MGEKKGISEKIRSFFHSTVSYHSERPLGDSVPKTKEDPEKLALKERVGLLEFEIEEQERKIHAIRRELEQVSALSRKEGEDARRLEDFLTTLTHPLSQLSAMQSFSESGREIAVTDLFKLFHQIEDAFKGQGVEAIGTVGECVPFDPRLHQPIGGRVFQDGEKVLVRFTGFIWGEKVLRKAMVGRNDE